MLNNNSPKISIVTPVFNQVNFIEDTIRSVIEQDYSNLEYIVIDGGSTDGTLDIIKKYDSAISFWLSEKDSGMYNALNKGFKRSTGEIMCWINSDDILLPGALFNMARLFNDLPKVNWIQGINSFIDLEGKVIDVTIAKKFSFISFLMGNYKWIQQESTFWRRSLWESAGGYVDDNLKFAGDFELWFRFFQHDKLYNSTLSIGAWRKREGQLSQSYLEDYLTEIDTVFKDYKTTKEEDEKLKKIKRLDLIINIMLKTKLIKASYFINQRENVYDLKKVCIQYSYSLKKFTQSR
jgi:glycosyltransferase involved in cell wall biosynthesis